MFENMFILLSFLSDPPPLISFYLIVVFCGFFEFIVLLPPPFSFFLPPFPLTPSPPFFKTVTCLSCLGITHLNVNLCFTVFFTPIFGISS